MSKRFTQLSVREQAEYIIEHDGLDKVHPEMTEDELIAEVIEFIICPVLQQQLAAKKERPTDDQIMRALCCGEKCKPGPSTGLCHRWDFTDETKRIRALLDRVTVKKTEVDSEDHLTI